MKNGNLGFNYPKKSQGDRCRAQALKFYNLFCNNQKNSNDYFEWAEQSARKSIMYDYTNYMNWEFLLKLKVESGDSKGVYIVLEDLLSVLGKEPFLIKQLKNINLLATSQELFYSILKREPLDANIWWDKIEKGEFKLSEFELRCQEMDFRDRRSNIIFGRRLERLRINGHDEIFFKLMPYLLAHRPDNHELWIELGKHHESFNHIKEALMCYEQVLTFKPNDKNKERLGLILKKKFDKITSYTPSKKEKISFHNKLEKLSKNKDINSKIIPMNSTPKDNLDPLEVKLVELIKNKEFQEAFFISRRLISEGETWAEKYFLVCKDGLLNG